MLNINSNLLTTRQAAALLGIHKDTLRHWRAENTGPAWVRVGQRAIRYSVASLDAFVTAQQATKSQPACVEEKASVLIDSGASAQWE